MNLTLQKEFLSRWEKYFGKSPLPVAFYYTDDPGSVRRANLPKERSCIICELAIVRKGTPLAWSTGTVKCGGASRYLGFADKLRPHFEHFLSKGLENEVEGERYIRTPGQVKALLKTWPCLPAPGKYIIFKRFDQLQKQDQPLGVIFFAKPDVLSGLFTLANYNRSDGAGVIAPFNSGCGSIVYQILRQADQKDQQAVLGMFDVSARPCVPKDILTLSIPMKKFTEMVGHMDESFLITESWNLVKKRL